MVVFYTPLTIYSLWLSFPKCIIGHLVPVELDNEAFCTIRNLRKV